MKNDEAARLIESLFGTWGPSLARYAYRATRSREAAEDMVQEVFMSLYRNLVAGKQIDNCKGWTLNAVRNQIAKHERDRKRHGEYLQSHDMLDLLPGVQMLQVPEQADDDLSKLLGVLSRREEEVILLRMQALKYREIGSQLGVSPKTVSALITRALHKLQQVVAARGRLPGMKQEGDARQTLQ
jgi:RNA polymerase sigma factor (sigma-70 family)